MGHWKGWALEISTFLQASKPLRTAPYKQQIHLELIRPPLYFTISENAGIEFRRGCTLEINRKPINVLHRETAGSYWSFDLCLPCVIILMTVFFCTFSTRKSATAAGFAKSSQLSSSRSGQTVYGPSEMAT